MPGYSSTPHIVWLTPEGLLPRRQALALYAMAALLQHEGPRQDFRENVYSVFLRAPIARKVSHRVQEMRQAGIATDVAQASLLLQTLLAPPEKKGSDEAWDRIKAFVANWVGTSATGAWAVWAICTLMTNAEVWADIEAAVQSDPTGRALLRGTREAKPTTKVGRRLLSSFWQALLGPQYDRKAADALRSNAETWAIVVVKYHNSPAEAFRGELKSWQQATLSRAMRPFDVALGLPRKRRPLPQDKQG